MAVCGVGGESEPGGGGTGGGGYDSHAPCPSWLRGERKMSETKTRNAPLDSLRTPGGKQAIRDEEKEERKTKQKAI